MVSRDHRGWIAEREGENVGSVFLVDEEPHHSYGVDLVAEDWELDL